MSDEERRERTAVYDGWWRCEILEDVEGQERLVESYAERNLGMVDQSDAAIARELLKMVRRSIERHDGALWKPMVSPVLVRAPAIHGGEYPSIAQTPVAAGPVEGGLGGGFWPYRTGVMRDHGCGLRRTPLPRTRVNRGKKRAAPA